MEKKITEKQKINDKFEKYAEKAQNTYNKYCTYCDKIFHNLIKLFPSEKEKIIDVIFQSSDGICVVYEELKNIPLFDFIEGVRI